MEALSQAVAGSSGKLVNILGNIAWATRDRAAGLLWTASGALADVSQVTGIRLRAVFYRFLAIFANVNIQWLFARYSVQRVVAGIAAALIIIIAPTGAASRIVMFSGGNSASLSGGLSEISEVLLSPGAGADAPQAVESLMKNYAPFSQRGGLEEHSTTDTCDLPVLGVGDNNADYSILAGVDTDGSEASRIHDEVPYSNTAGVVGPVQPAQSLVKSSLSISQHTPIYSGLMGSYPDFADDSAVPVVTEGDAWATEVLSGEAPDEVVPDDSGSAEWVSSVSGEAPDYSEPRPLTASTGLYAWPADGTVSSRFGYRRTGVGSTNHKGIDISGSYGQSIFAADGGEVIVSEWSNSYGYMIRILHDNGDVTLYCHCRSLLVEVGEFVRQGQVIAQMGRTGIADGVHLHFELMIGGVQVDPLPYLQKAGG